MDEVLKVGVDGLFTNVALFAMFALVIGFTFTHATSFLSIFLRIVTYGVASLTFFAHPYELSSGLYVNFWGVPLAIAAFFAGTSRALALALVVALYTALLGEEVTTPKLIHMSLIMIVGGALRWGVYMRLRPLRALQNTYTPPADLDAGPALTDLSNNRWIWRSVRAYGYLAALIFIPSSIMFNIIHWGLDVWSGVAWANLALQFGFSVLGFILWATTVLLMRRGFRSARTYQVLATRDALTGLLNRYAFETDKPDVSGPDRFLLLLDLDHFKSLNDRFGHLAGDDVLRNFGTLLQMHVEGSKLEQTHAYRVGGEEFAVRIQGTRQQAEALAQTIQTEVAHLLTQRFHIAWPDAQDRAITLSGGLVADGPKAFQEADDLLYTAKNAGRNCLAVAWKLPLAPLVQPPLNAASPAVDTFRSLLRFLAHQGGTMPDLQGLMEAAILCVPGAEAGSLWVRRGSISVIEAQVGFSPELLGFIYPAPNMQAWHGDPTGHVQGRPRILVGQALHQRRLDLADKSPDIDKLSGQSKELQANLLLPILVGGQVFAELNLDNLHDPHAFSDASLVMAEEFGLWAAAMLSTHQQRLQTQLAQEGALLVLGLAMETRGGEATGHTRRVVELATALGRWLNLSAQHIAALRQGAYLHDLGKLQIPDEVLLKPGSLNAAEQNIMHTHTLLGAELAAHFPGVLPGTLDIVRSHHEHWNGGGYPAGLARTDIPLLARIFAVADCYDALISVRPHRGAWTEQAALLELKNQRGQQLDPEVVDAFFRWFQSAARTSDSAVSPLLN
ncbi:HD domain-containing phosphohydrolase [Deinococcus sp. QL22]|uniref:bifunctional diguanylate cyclase/phosphohydrolase n=1 Tax=Deinococcus sp. QL22 TaxID=2939437 RepID=UPI00201733D2|nr:HD domain-containing phosphohydrolase [Deinococcus sp. QL22]UQN06247.1 diguanylate cyclase [Deinococcus sp. QL22]